MKINSLQFMKIPIDSSYSNVFSVSPFEKKFVREFNGENFIEFLRNGDEELILDGWYFVEITTSNETHVLIDLSYRLYDDDTYTDKNFMYLDFSNAEPNSKYGVWKNLSTVGLQYESLSVSQNYSFNVAEIKIYKYENLAFRHNDEYKKFLFNKMTKTYEPLDIEMSSLKSVNTTDSGFNINIKSDNFSRDYSYCVAEIVDGNYTTFNGYFISSITEENSIGNYSITLEYDVFSNEYFKLWNKEFDQYVSVSDIKNITADYTEYHNLVKFDYKGNVIESHLTVPRKKEYHGRYIEVVWAIIALNTKNTSPEIGSFLDEASDGVYVYAPVYMYDSIRDILYTYNLDAQVGDETVPTFNLSKFHQEFIESIQYTYNPPFDYEVVESGGNYNIIVTSPCGADMIRSDGAIVTSSNVIYPIQGRSNNYTGKEYTFEIPSTSTGYRQVDMYKNDSDYYRELVKHYPYTKYVLEVGNVEIPIDFGVSLKSISVRVFQTNHGIRYNVKFIGNGNEGDSEYLSYKTTFGNVELQGFVRLSKEAIDGYLRNNQYSYEETLRYSLDKTERSLRISENKLQDIADQGVMSALITGAASALGGTSSIPVVRSAKKTRRDFDTEWLIGDQIISDFEHIIHDREATEKDLLNSAQQITTYSSYAQMNMQKQDCVRLAKYVPIVGTPEYNRLIHNLKSYGECRKKYVKLPIYDVNREFNFLKMEECVLNSITNFGYRETLNSILTRGVRIWYINTFTDKLLNSQTANPKLILEENT